MDFVTLTDHDTIDGALAIADRSDVLVGEELTCWFPEDHCKMHVLVYGIARDQHEALQSLAENMYDVADYIEQQPASPIRSRIRFTGRTTNSSDGISNGCCCCSKDLNVSTVRTVRCTARRSSRCSIASRRRRSIGFAKRMTCDRAGRSRGSEARTAGSDDHGLLNVGRTWTEFPGETRSGRRCTGMPAATERAVPAAKRDRAPSWRTRFTASPFAITADTSCRLPSGQIWRPRAAPDDRRRADGADEIAACSRSDPHEATAHRETNRSSVCQTASGRCAGDAVWHGNAQAALSRIVAQAVSASTRSCATFSTSGLPPLGEHEQYVRFVERRSTAMSRAAWPTRSATASTRRASPACSIRSARRLRSSSCCLPYYFAVFHQNKERHLLRQITRQHTPKTAATLKVGLFTDTFDEINGVGRFMRDMGEQAQRIGTRADRCTPARQARQSSRHDRQRISCPCSRVRLPYYEDIVAQPAAAAGDSGVVGSSAVRRGSRLHARADGAVRLAGRQDAARAAAGDVSHRFPGVCRSSWRAIIA